ncbi:MAG: putative sulfate exporter family transporter [Desulfovibrionaceae bacterium]|nr:putative sulfate exporter family transporter [Desulfovibrionaceae bacterium]
MSQNQDVVIDKAQSTWSDLWKKEDYWAIWLGLAFSLLALYLYVFSYPADKLAQNNDVIAKAEATMQAEAARAPFKTIEWYQAQSTKKVKPAASDFAKSLNTYMGRPGSWSSSPMDGLIVDKAKAEAKAEKAKPAAEKAKAAAAEALATATLAQEAAAAAQFGDTALNSAADKKIQDWRAAERKASKAADKTKVKSYNLLTTLPVLFVGLALAFGIGIAVMGQAFMPFVIGFAGVFVFTVLAMVLGSWSVTKYYGVSTEAWAILLGMLLANTIGTPKWIKPALQVEFYIKTGLVLLGCEILLDKIIAIGIPGLFVAWVVTPIVLIGTYIFGQKIVKMPSKTLNITISADMSVCGTSAAIAAAAACRAKKEELALSVGISLLFTAIMMIVMPIVIKALGLPDVLGGAWIGGTIDSTGAVAAAGAFLGERAMYVAATIKMIQNVLIGVSAFCIAVYWVTKVDRVEGAEVHFTEVWHRFPKFVLGFLAASVIFSYYSGLLGPDVSNGLITAGAIKSATSPLRAWCFTLSFAAIGLATNFRELASYFKGGKPVILYVCGQSFNLALTLAMAYVMFYLVFPEITARI